MSSPDQRYQISYQDQPPEDMTYAEFLAAVTAVNLALASVTAALAAPYQSLRLDRIDWLGFLSLVYPYVVEARFEIGALARRFYDSERAKYLDPIEVPLLDFTEDIIGPDGRPVIIDDPVDLTREVYPRLDMFLAPYEPDWFEEAMDAVVLPFSRPNATDAATAAVVSQVVKEAENAGRRTTLWAVQDDPNIVGWARVEGNENIGSCGFCAMLISRGPVYKEATDSGLDLDNTSAVEIFRQAEATGDDSELMELMTRWHPNCDCKVVPVFDRKNWTGRDEYERLESLWGTVTKGLSGRDALNAFRRAIENGDSAGPNRLPIAA